MLLTTAWAGAMGPRVVSLTHKGHENCSHSEIWLFIY